MGVKKRGSSVTGVERGKNGSREVYISSYPPNHRRNLASAAGGMWCSQVKDAGLSIFYFLFWLGVRVTVCSFLGKEFFYFGVFYFALEGGDGSI